MLIGLVEEVVDKLTSMPDVQTIGLLLFSIYVLKTYVFTSAKNIYVAELYVYPIKGCGGIRVEKVSMCTTGFKHDRRWMIVDESGKFVTQREKPELCNIWPLVQEDGTLVLW